MAGVEHFRIYEIQEFKPEQKCGFISIVLATPYAETHRHEHTLSRLSLAHSGAANDCTAYWLLDHSLAHPPAKKDPNTGFCVSDYLKVKSRKGTHTSALIQTHAHTFIHTMQRRNERHIHPFIDIQSLLFLLHFPPLSFNIISHLITDTNLCIYVFEKRKESPASLFTQLVSRYKSPIETEQCYWNGE